VPHSGEDDLIARYFAPLAGEGGLGLKDDAALVSVEPGFQLVVTCDALVAGVHFFPDDPPDAIAAKALRVNLSDLAAKGATPKGFILALALPHDAQTLSQGERADAWLGSFAAGLGADIATYKCPLLGGDTVKTPGPLMVSITAFGAVPTGRMVPRTGARPGDLLYVTGTIGDAALGLQIRLGTFTGRGDHLLARYLRPRPRNALASVLLDCASAAMDVSDGLVGDLTKMMRVSGACAGVDAASVPLSPEAAALIGAHAGAFETALTGGDDYEILASVPPQNAGVFEARAAEAGVPVTRIGHVLRGDGSPLFRDASGAPMSFARGSFSHF
jgi:thiamine-monophosphate kinase